MTSVETAAGSIEVANAEIASGHHGLSARTEKSKSNLEENITSMAQLKSTMRQRADSARQAKRPPSSPSEIAVRGERWWAQVVTMANEIHASGKKTATSSA